MGEVLLVLGAVLAGFAFGSSWARGHQERLPKGALYRRVPAVQAGFRCDCAAKWEKANPDCPKCHGHGEYIETVEWGYRKVKRENRGRK